MLAQWLPPNPAHGLLRRGLLSDDRDSGICKVSGQTVSNNCFHGCANVCSKSRPLMTVNLASNQVAYGGTTRPREIRACHSAEGRRRNTYEHEYFSFVFLLFGRRSAAVFPYCTRNINMATRKKRSKTKRTSKEVKQIKTDTPSKANQLKEARKRYTASKSAKGSTSARFRPPHPSVVLRQKLRSTTPAVAVPDRRNQTFAAFPCSAAPAGREFNAPRRWLRMPIEIEAVEHAAMLVDKLIRDVVTV